MMIVARSASTLGLAVLAAVASLQAQTVRGQLVDKANGVPIAGAFVVLLDQDGAEVARVLTSGSGSFLLRAPGPGTYRLQSKRIGFRVSESPPIAIGEGETVGYRLVVEAVPAQLEEVIVEGRPQCGTRGERGTAVARLWDEAREALAAVRWTEALGTYRYTVQRFERELPPVGVRVLSERRSTWSGQGQTPFRSLPARELADRGYVVVGSRDTVDYYAPDADVLLGDVFVNTHCFTARTGDAQHPGLVGLAFEPVPGRRRPDVSGVLWLERRTLELRFLDFKYTDLPADLPEGPLGGHVEFMRLPSGVWIVRDWWIRMARMGRIVYQNAIRPPEPKVMGFRETGAQVTSVATSTGAVVYSAQQSILEGTVVDSSRSGGPLRGAVVRLTGTDLAATADHAGRFQITAPLDGMYGIAFSHPRLDSLGAPELLDSVRLVRGERSTVTLAIPPEPVILGALCPGGLGERARVIVGVVRDAVGEEVAGAQVRGSWQVFGPETGPIEARNWAAVTQADSAGRYTLCGAPWRLVTLSAAVGPIRGHEVQLDFSETGVWVDKKQFFSLPGQVWTQDLEVR